MKEWFDGGVKMSRIEYIANRVEHYLQVECSDEWHVKIDGNKILAFYTSEKRFELTYDGGFEDWYITGEYLQVEMIGEISIIIKLYEERGL